MNMKRYYFIHLLDILGHPVSWLGFKDLKITHIMNEIKRKFNHFQIYTGK